MSYLKSSLFYLKDINDFLKTKFDTYSDLNTYMSKLYENEKEVLPFLENVIMNKHYYDLVKDNYIADAKSQKQFNNTIRICSIVFDSLLIAILVVLIVKALSGTSSAWKKAEALIVYILIIISVNFILIWISTSNKNKMNDYDGRIQSQIPVEANFVDFNKPDGVAMYFALKRGFAEPPTSKYRKEIKKYYNLYAPVIPNDTTGVKFTNYPSVSNFIKGGQFYNDWKNIIDSTTHAATTIFQHVQSNGNVKSDYDSIDKQITYSDTITLMKEIHNQGDKLKSYVSNTVIADVQLSPKDIKNIITNEVIPAFNIKSTMDSLDGLMMKDTSLVKLVSQPEVTSNSTECMLKCELNDACLVAAFNIPSKKCTMMTSKIAKGSVLEHSLDDSLFIKDDGKNNLFLQGNGLIENVSGLYTTEQDGDCKTSCLAGPECVMYTEKSGKCEITTGDTNMAVSNINDCSADSNCTFYKNTVSAMGKEYDLSSMIDVAKNSITLTLVAVVQKYKYEFSISDNVQDISSGLQEYFGIDGYKSISDKINTILDNAETQATQLKKSLKPVTPTYITQDQFVKNMNSMTYADFGDMYYSVDTLNTVVGTLNTIVQSNISTNLSAENNMFLSQERGLNNKKWIISNISILMVIGFLYYLVSWHNSSSLQKGGTNVKAGVTKFASTFKNSSVDNIFKILIPIVFISFAIVIMVSSYQKQEALNTYNREVLEKNGGNLVAAIDNLEQNMQLIHDGIKKTNKQYSLTTEVKDMSVASDDEKNTYTYLISVIDLLEKCNLLMEGSDIVLPFPWTDVTVNLITVFVCVLVLFTVIGQIDPIGKMGEIRELNILQNKIRAGVSVNLSFLDYDDNDDIGITLKVISLIVFIIIVVMFSQKLLQSSQNYKMGLYNSKYYTESKCAN